MTATAYRRAPRALPPNPQWGNQSGSPAHPRAVRTVTADGVHLSGHEYGDSASAHTVVFVHGFCLSKESWEPQIRGLSARYGGTLRLISYDHRGHGQSQAAPTRTYRISQLADDLAAVINQMRVRGRVTLVGHSMGAMVALSYLARTSPAQQPQGLVLVAGAAGRLTQRGLGRLLTTPAVGLLSRMTQYLSPAAVHLFVAPLCAAVARQLRGHSARGTLPDVIASALTTTPAETVFGFLPTFQDFDEYRTLGLIRARTIVVSGDADVITPVAHSLDLAAGVPGATHICVAGAGHMVAQQAPLTVEQAITLASGINQTHPPAANRSDQVHPRTRPHAAVKQCGRSAKYPPRHAGARR